MDKKSKGQLILIFIFLVFIAITAGWKALGEILKTLGVVLLEYIKLLFLMFYTIIMNPVFQAFATPEGLIQYIVGENVVITSYPILDKILFYLAGLIPSCIFFIISKVLKIDIPGKLKSCIFIILYIGTVMLLANWVVWAVIGAVGLIIISITIWLRRRKQ